MIVKVKVVVAVGQVAFDTLIVNTTVAPEAISAPLKLYVGVSVVLFVIDPKAAEVVVAVHDIVP